MSKLRVDGQQFSRPTQDRIDPAAIEGACPWCGDTYEISAGTSDEEKVCSKCGQLLSPPPLPEFLVNSHFKNAQALFDQGITEETIKQFETTLKKIPTLQPDKIKQITDTLRTGLPTTQPGAQPTGPSNTQQNTTNQPLKPVGKGIISMKIFAKDVITKVAVDFPDIHDSLEKLRDTSDTFEILDLFEDKVPGLGKTWVITPFEIARFTSPADESNYEAVVKSFEESFPDDFKQVRSYGGPTWIAVRAFEEDGSVSPAGELLEQLMGSLADYPLLDDTDYSQREFDAQIEAIREGVWPILDEDLLPEGKDVDAVVQEVFDWLWENNQRALEMEESLGAFNVFVTKKDVKEALDALGYAQEE